jgi:hypothetical protein
VIGFVSSAERLPHKRALNGTYSGTLVVAGEQTSGTNTLAISGAGWLALGPAA